jgi:hypothetical protein
MQSKQITSTWKKVLIIGLCVLGAAGLTYGVLCCQIYYDKYHRFKYYEHWSDQVSPYIMMDHGYRAGENFVQLRDIRTGEYTTPRLEHVFLNEYDVEDSLVVFRTHDRLRGYVNLNTGRIIIPAQYKRAWNFSEGVAAVYKDGFVSFINEDGTLAFPKTFPIRYDDGYSEISFQFHDGLCVMRTMSNKWGLINMQGEWVVEPVYNSMDAPYHGCRCVCNGVRYGLIYSDGPVALPMDYDAIRRASDGRGWILVKDGIAQEVDFQFNVLIPFVHDGIHTLSYVDDYRSRYYDEDAEQPQTQPEPRFFRFDIGQNSGVIDAKGHIIIPARYYNVRIVNDDLFEVEMTYDGERLLYDTKGRYVGKSGV